MEKLTQNQKRVVAGISVLGLLVLIVLLVVSFIALDKDLKEERQKHNEREREYATKIAEKFQAGEVLFCNGHQIISSKSGWVFDGDYLIKDDRYFSLYECFPRSK